MDKDDENESDEKMVKLDFQNDIYSFTYLKFMLNQNNNPI